MVHSVRRPAVTPSRGVLERILFRVVRAVVPNARRDDVMGDLEQSFRARVERCGRLPARLHLLREAVALALWRVRVSGSSPRRDTALLPDLLQDVRFGARTLARRPAFAMTAALVMGLGIGAPATVLTLVSRMFFEPPPEVVEPHRLFTMYRAWDDQGVYGSIEHADYRYYRERATTLAGLAASGGTTVAGFSVLGGDAGQLEVDFTSENYFDVLGVLPYLGRFFVPEDNRAPGERPVLVLSHDFWARSFAHDPRVIGRTVTVNGQIFEVVGVVPPDFRGLSPADAPPDAWAPIAMFGAVTRPRGTAWWERVPGNRSNWLTVFGRLAPGVAFEAAEANLVALSSALDSADRGAGETVKVSRHYLYNPGQTEALGRLSGMLLAVVGFVLVVAGANVAVLLLSRATSRRREIGIRTAIGAARGRLFRQLLSESLVLGAAGAAVGITLAFAFSDLAASLLPYRFAVSFTPDLRVLLAAVGLSLLTACVVGLAPALHAAGTKTIEVIGDGRSASSRGRLRDALVVVQVALSIVLVSGAVLFGESFGAAAGEQLGWESERTAVVRVDLRSQGYDAARGRVFVRDALERLAALPGVRAVSASRMIPFNGDWSVDAETPTDRFPDAVSSTLFIGLNAVGPDYFEVMGIPLLGGRVFGPEDRQGAPAVAVINRALEQALWPGGSALGKTLPEISATQHTVVGVVADATDYQLGETPVPHAYTYLEQAYQPDLYFLVHGAGDAAARIGAVQAALRELDPTVPFRQVTTLEEVVAGVVARYRVSAVLVGLFSSLALVLAATGVYGVVSFLVAQRTREIGVRIALGANRTRISAQVLGGAMRLSAIGVIIGSGMSLWLRRFVEGMLYRVEAEDPWPLAAACVVLATVTVIAALAPARRAARVDPLESMRAE